VSALVVSFVESWKNALIVMMLTVALILVTAGFARVILQVKRKTFEGQVRVGSVVEEVISCTRNVTAFEAQETSAQRYDRRLGEAERWSLRKGRLFQERESSLTKLLQHRQSRSVPR
jgi:ATP-binding cassette subfamily B (MDR/TAP) protein 1